MKALSRGCHFAIRSRQDCVTSRDDNALLRDRLRDRGQRQQCRFGAD